MWTAEQVSWTHCQAMDTGAPHLLGLTLEDTEDLDRAPSPRSWQAGVSDIL
jgi:hypothetical protein